MAINTTQDHIPVKDIKNDIVLLKNGSAVLVLQVPAVNFGLLSSREQMGIIYAFAQLINSLSFSIQIVIYSRRLNISSYLKLLDKARAAQTNPLLLRMMGSYHAFIQSTVKENDVLDKKFYMIIPLYSEEVGITYSEDVLLEKIRTILHPRREQILRLLNRIGLRAEQLDNQGLLDLFYKIYNTTAEDQPIQPPTEQTIPQPETTEKTTPSVVPTQVEPAPIIENAPSPVADPKINQDNLSQPIRARNHPFVVEELGEGV